MKVVILKSILGLGFVGMLVMNYLANALPLNNRNTGEISDLYPSYFTPSGFTFSIWGVIYILLSIVTIRFIITPQSDFFNQYQEKFMYLFFATTIFNALWLLAWHYDYMVLSTVVMILLFISLIWIAFFLPNLSVLTKTTFSIYAGWISIALIANITITLVKLQVPIFTNHEAFWYISITCVGLLIGVASLVITKNFPYFLVYIWAYFGIFMKHLSQNGYYLDKQMNIYNASLLSMFIIIGIVMFVINDYKFLK